MKNKVWYGLLTATGLVAMVLCVRQRTLNELRAGNEALRQQFNAQTPETAAGATLVVTSTNPVVALSPDERMELLRLRGQFLPLRRELQEMSNRLTSLAQPAPRRVSTKTKQFHAPEEIDRIAETERFNAYMRTEPYMNARSLNTALGDYLKAHSGEIPDDLAKVEASARSPLPHDVSERFELIRSGKVSEEALTYTFVAREKEPQQLKDGKWQRLYLGADGGTHSPTIGSAKKSDWENWERYWEAFLKKQAQQKKPDR